MNVAGEDDGVETFLVRVWVAGDGQNSADGTELRGIVEHVGSRSSDAFKGTEELVALLQAATASATTDTTAR